MVWVAGVGGPQQVGHRVCAQHSLHRAFSDAHWGLVTLFRLDRPCGQSVYQQLVGHKELLDVVNDKKNTKIHLKIQTLKWYNRLLWL